MNTTDTTDTTDFAEYSIQWVMDIDATGPVDAALRALATIRANGPDHDAHVFLVSGPDGRNVEVDLDTAPPTLRTVNAE
ncbi:hypothetical protein ABT224_36130 [Streptomyces sp. NPDC001584]|uniref:hypothetical protein n=1 Tax=Streptomyces sp. NPDC001584 TaxID=3154521 RepID=UPI00331A3BEE